jgi:hypothetical protein
VQFQPGATTALNVLFDGNMYNDASGASGGGQQISGTYGPHSAGTIGAWTTRTWDPSGYYCYNNTTWDHNVRNGTSWNASGYPGHWYIYGRSIPSHTTDHAIYRFRAVTALSGDTAGSGWHS